jgi:hypothetical protein
VVAPDFDSTFQKYREFLHQEKSALASFVTIHRQLYERRDDRLKEINIAPAFFQTVTWTLYSSIIIWTDKLLDKKGQTGYFDFLKLVENNLDAFSISELQRRTGHSLDHWFIQRMIREPVTIETITGHRRQILDLAPLPAIKLRRNKLHAHFDKKYFFERWRFEDEAPLKWGNFESVIELMQEILNTYSAAFDGHSMSREPINTTDLNHLLNRLHLAMERK